MKKLFWVILCLLAIHGSAGAGLTITSGRESHYRIVIPQHPSPQEERAAQLLQHYLNKISGCSLAIEQTNIPAGGNVILIRRSQTVENPDGFRIRTHGKRLLIEGGSHKGCIYGVVTLLERWLGCRKYSTDFEIIPRQENIELPDIHYEDAPVNTLRIVNGSFGLDADYKDWQRLDMVKEVFPEGYYVHTFHRLIPWEVYFDDHPEYFALMNGKRIIDQPCLSHPDVLRISLNKLREEMEKQPDRQVWSVSQNDNFSYCQCDRCREIIKEEASPAGPVIRFVNAVADSFPNRVISTLAYQYSRKAPVKTIPRENVQVMLCTIELKRSMPIASDPTSVSFLRDMEDWGKICRHIYLWDYTVNFNHHVNPFPNLHVLQPNIQLFTRNNIHEHFQQTNTGNGHEFAEQKAYLLARLLWNPSVNADSVTNDFLRGYYGDGAPMIAAYIGRLQNELQKSGERLDIYEHPTAHQFSILSAENVARYNEYFNEAEAKVLNDSVRLLHVRTARLPLQYAMMEIGKNDMFGPRGWYLQEDGEWILRGEMAATLETFNRICLLAGVESLNESGLTPEKYYTTTRRFIDVQVKGNMAFRKQVTANPPPEAKYSQGDQTILTNGVFGAGDFRAHWLGWEAKNFSLMIDLDTLTPIDTIRISTLWEGKSWIFHPAAITCSVSADGINFIPAGKSTVEGDQRAEPVSRTFSFFPGQIRARYVRFEVTGLLRNPDWHPSAGGGCWVFVDEIVVR